METKNNAVLKNRIKMKQLEIDKLQLEIAEMEMNLDKPQKSAFQKWKDENFADVWNNRDISIAEEAYNFAIRSVLSKKCTIMNDAKTDVLINVVDVSEIEALKEP